jgi:hypothetical protein
VAIIHDRKISRLQLLEILKRTVCEIFFIRRHPEKFRPSDRNMLCSNCYELLNSPNGRRALGYRPPKGLPNFNPDAVNLIITWDILQMDFRCVNMTYSFLIKEYETHDEFWQTFNDTYHKMTPLDKLAWMDGGFPAQYTRSKTRK